MANVVRDKAAMKRICAWCNKVMKEGVEPATHGICRPCVKKVMENYERSRSSSVGGTPKSSRGVALMI